MTVGYLDAVQFTSSTSGTSAFTVSAAVAGYQTPSGAGAVNGVEYHYYAYTSGQAQWELGRGAYTSSGTTQARTTIIAGSNGTSAVNFSSNPTVAYVQLAEDIIGNTYIGPPGGRVTLVSNTAVMTANETAKGTIYYTPYLHNYVPLYNNAQTGWQMMAFSQLSITLDSTNTVSGKIYDLFLFNNAGTIDFGYGPAWSSNTSRGTGAGSTAISQDSITSYWTNTVAITLRNTSSVTYSAAAGQALYVGTFYATAAGQTGVAYTASASPAGACIVGIFNAYNQVPINVTNLDTTVSYTYNSSTWRHANNSATDAISFVDGLGVISGKAEGFTEGGSSAAAANEYAFGVMLNWSSGAPTYYTGWDVVSDSYYFTISSCTTWAPTLGYNTAYLVESSAVGTAEVNDGVTSGLWIAYSGMY